MTHPMAVTSCNIDMESLITDHNRSIATLAITTLLKTGNEGSVERLIKQVCPETTTESDCRKIKMRTCAPGQLSKQQGCIDAMASYWLF